MQILTAATEDVIQKATEKFKIPEIRVWCHPHRIGKEGDDHYMVFKSFKDAFRMIELNPDLTEDIPLVAIGGYELNLFELKELPPEGS